jgi:hypothetical protein
MADVPLDVAVRDGARAAKAVAADPRLAGWYRVVAARIAQDPEVRDAVHGILSARAKPAASMLLNDIAVLRDPLLGADLQGQRKAFNECIEEIADPAHVARRIGELEGP